MAIPSIFQDDSPTRASDSMQAAYFRGALADRRDLVAADVSRQIEALNSLTTKSDAVAISRLRSDIRNGEAERRELDRMIDALDRRFAPGWADQG
jgi:hypothetical protein